MSPEFVSPEFGIWCPRNILLSSEIEITPEMIEVGVSYVIQATSNNHDFRLSLGV